MRTNGRRRAALTARTAALPECGRRIGGHLASGNLAVLIIALLVAPLGLTIPSGSSAAAADGSQKGDHETLFSETPLTPPTSIDATCSTDMTTELNLWFASLPAGTVVDLPSDGCYLVSNSSSSLLAIENTSRLTINGEGATFEQGSYSNGGNNDPGPILTLGFDRDLTIKNITVRGPSSAGASEHEGDRNPHVAEHRRQS